MWGWRWCGAVSSTPGPRNDVPVCGMLLRNSGGAAGKIQHVEGTPRCPPAPWPGNRGARGPAPAGQAGGSAGRAARCPDSRRRRPCPAARPLDSPSPAPFGGRNGGRQSRPRRRDRPPPQDWHVTGKAHSGRPDGTRPVSRPGRPGSRPRSGIGLAGRPSRRVSYGGVVTEVPTPSNDANLSTLGAYAPATAVGSGGLIDLNSASEADLQALPGIGPARARAVLAYRRDKGSFAAVSDLARVSGFGRLLVARLTPFLRVR